MERDKCCGLRTCNEERGDEGGAVASAASDMGGLVRCFGPRSVTDKDVLNGGGQAVVALHALCDGESDRAEIVRWVLDPTAETLAM